VPTSKERQKKLPYNEGDWFAVPLRKGRRYAVGRIARVAPHGRIVLGYFFGPSLKRFPKAEALAEYLPKDAILVARCGDLGLINGQWKVIGSSSWRRNQWKMPKFKRSESISGATFVVRYADGDPSREVSEKKVEPSSVAVLAENGLWGSGAVEIRLTKLLMSGR
jgi:hypothetical protein